MTNRVEFRPLEEAGKSAAGLSSLGRAHFEAADIAARWGAEATDVWQLSQVGKVALARAGLEKQTPVNARGYLAGYQADTASAAVALNYATLANVNQTVRYNYLKSKIVSTNANPYSVALILGQSGDYQTANSLCLDWLGRTDADTADQLLALCAAYSSVATGVPGKTRQTRGILTNFGESVSFPAVLGMTAGGIDAALQFRGLIGVYDLARTPVVQGAPPPPKM